MRERYESFASVTIGHHFSRDGAPSGRYKYPTSRSLVLTVGNKGPASVVNRLMYMTFPTRIGPTYGSPLGSGGTNWLCWRLNDQTKGQFVYWTAVSGRMSRASNAAMIVNGCRIHRRVPQRRRRIHRRHATTTK